MVTLTTACLYESSDKFHYLKDFMESPLKYIASQQREDGSFEYNVATTALAIQALDIPRMTGLNYSVEWQPDKALEWLESAQLPDGSFGDIFTTTEVLMALSKRGYATFHYDKCPDPCCAYAGKTELQKNDQLQKALNTWESSTFLFSFKIPEGFFSQWIHFFFFYWKETLI